MINISPEKLALIVGASIEELALDSKAFLCLKEADINTVGDLLKKNDAELIAIFKSDSTAFEELKTGLKALVKKLNTISQSQMKTALSGLHGAWQSSGNMQVDIVVNGINESGTASINCGTDPIRDHSVEKEEKDPFDASILDLDISSKAYYALRFSGFDSIIDILSHSQGELSQKYRRLNYDNLKEVDEAIRKLAIQKGFDKDLEDCPFFSEASVQAENEPKELPSNQSHKAITEESDTIRDIKREWTDDELSKEYGQLYYCVQELLKEQYDNGTPIWMDISELQTKLEIRCPFLGEVIHDQEKINTILNHASWATAVSFFYSWKPRKSQSTVEENRTNMNLSDCIREILIQRKEKAQEWVMAMTVYDILKESYPSVAETNQLVDVRDVLTKSKWIEKEDIYYRIAERDFTERSSICDSERQETLAGDTMQARINAVKMIPIEELDLSVRSLNCLRRGNIKVVGDLVKMTPDELLKIQNLGALSQKEIREKLDYFLQNFDVEAFYDESDSNDSKSIEDETEQSPQQKIVQGTIIVDLPINQLGLSVRASNCLTRAGIKTVSEILYWTREDFLKLRNMGVGSANEIIHKIQELYESGQIVAAVSEEEMSVAKEEYYTSDSFLEGLRNSIISLLITADQNSLSIEDIKSQLPEPIDEKYLLPVIERLIKEGEISEEKGRYKKVFPSILKAIEILPEDHQNYIRGRLEGKTLDEVGKNAGVTRERVRQIVSKDINALRVGNKQIKPVYGFAEDKYKYLYEHYSVGKNEWVNVVGKPIYIYYYLQIAFKKGSQSLKLALDDDLVDDDIKQNIKMKEDEDYIIVGNKRLLKTRSVIEDYVISHFFKNEGTIDEFYDAYNSFLEENGIEDKKLYINENLRRTRENSIASSRKVLWKQNRRLRYYDIDGTDLDELFDTLDLNQYENIELSTYKFIRDYPELMAEYDIRDEYELHNLLKKTCKREEYNIDFGRMPGIVFGQFDRNEAVKEMLFSLAPITIDDLAEAISEKYGFKVPSIKANWLNAIDEYYFNGEYHIEDEDEQILTAEQLQQLSELLNDDFYLTEEVTRAYFLVTGEKRVPRVYILKRMGFKVYSDYIFRGAETANEFFVKLLTSEDVVDLSAYGSKLRYLVSFNMVEYALREEYEILEFEPHKYVNIRRLAAFGMDKADVITYCKEVKQFVGEDEYFTIPWLRRQGFTSKLEDLGFEDFFYEAILSMDPGIFSFIQRSEKRRGSALLKVGDKLGSKTDFLIKLIEKERSIDRDDLVRYCIDNYNISVSDNDLYKGLEDSDVYYDSIMGKYYANYSLYYEEI